jgi:hypothetical protein
MKETPGGNLRIIDHELAFTHGVVVNWQPPWIMGGLKPFEGFGFHIFRKGLLGRDIDYGPVRGCWQALPDGRIGQYQRSLPCEWTGLAPAIDKALKLIRDARDNIEACLTEVKRVLS